MYHKRYKFLKKYVFSILIWLKVLRNRKSKIKLSYIKKTSFYFCIYIRGILIIELEIVKRKLNKSYIKDNVNFYKNVFLVNRNN